jgi:hypothetical protein
MKISEFLENIKFFLKPNINVYKNSDSKPHVVEQAEMVRSVVTQNADRALDVAEGLHNLVVSEDTKVYQHSDFAISANQIFWGLKQIAKWSPYLPNEILARIGKFLFQDSMKELVKIHEHDMIIEEINRKDLIHTAIENNNYNLIEYLIDQGQDINIDNFVNNLIGDRDDHIIEYLKIKFE